jgi:hypothetical protein
VWVYVVGLGWEEKQVDGNKVKLMGSLMGTKGF